MEEFRLIITTLYATLFAPMLIIKKYSSPEVRYIQRCAGDEEFYIHAEGVGILLPSHISNIFNPWFWIEFNNKQQYIPEIWKTRVEDITSTRNIKEVWHGLEKDVNEICKTHVIEGFTNFKIKQNDDIQNTEAWVECEVTINDITYDAILTWRNSD